GRQAPASGHLSRNAEVPVYRPSTWTAVHFARSWESVHSAPTKPTIRSGFTGFHPSRNFPTPASAKLEPACLLEWLVPRRQPADRNEASPQCGRRGPLPFVLQRCATGKRLDVLGLREELIRRPSPDFAVRVVEHQEIISLTIRKLQPDRRFGRIGHLQNEGGPPGFGIDLE